MVESDVRQIHLQVRERCESDVDACVDVLVDVYIADGYPVEGVADAHGWLRVNGTVEAWVAEVAHEIVGHSALVVASSDDKEMWRDFGEDSNSNLMTLCRVFVKPGWRGIGAGEQLVRAAMARARTSGAILLLDVMEKDLDAVRLYERLGWRRIGSSTHHYGDGRAIECFWYKAPEP